MLYLGISNWNVKILLNIFKSSQSVKFWHHSLGKIKTLKYLDCLLAELSWYFSPVMANLIVKVEESTAVMKLSCMFWKSTNTEMMKVILFFSDATCIETTLLCTQTWILTAWQWLMLALYKLVALHSPTQLWISPTLSQITSFYHECFYATNVDIVCAYFCIIQICCRKKSTLKNR